MKSGRNHRPIVFPLAKVATQTAITSIRYQHHWIRTIVIDGLADGVVLSQSFDIAKGFLVLWKPLELDPFASEVRKYRRPFREARKELGDVINEA